MSDTLTDLLAQEQARSVRLEAERNHWAGLAGEKEGEITTLRERLADAERTIQCIEIAPTMAEIAVAGYRKRNADSAPAVREACDLCGNDYEKGHAKGCLLNSTDRGVSDSAEGGQK